MGRSRPQPPPGPKSRRARHDSDAPPIQENCRDGLVVAGHGQTVAVEDERGHLAECNVRRRIGRLVCGDRVRWQATERGQGVVVELLPRSTLVERHDGLGRGKPLAANVDQVIVVVAPAPTLSEDLIDRYLVAAELLGAAPVIVINKTDLMASDDRAIYETRLGDYARLDCPALFTSSKTGEGMAALQQQFQHHTSILVGQSGVGKSSLVRGFLPDREIRVGRISEATGLGRHTTTHTALYHLQDGGDLIDSPGVRDFQLWHIPPDQVAAGFREFHPYAGQCRFHNCRHLAEPGCAVSQAAEAGEISARRLQSYRRIVGQLENVRG